MKITEDFIKEILKEKYPQNYQKIYDDSYLLQYLDKKMKAVHGNSKTRRSLANIYAIYAILYFYKNDFYNKSSEYKKFGGYDYMRLFTFYRGLYGGSKLQNHALNSRVNGEFKNKFPNEILEVAFKTTEVQKTISAIKRRAGVQVESCPVESEVKYENIKTWLVFLLSNQ